VRPRIAIPVHGEARHLAAHAKLAEECQVGQGLAVSNGALIQLRPSGAEILEHVHVGRIGLDGKALLPLDSEVMRVRHRTIWNGSAVVSLAINRRGELLGEPQITVHGLLNEKDHGEELAELRETVGAAVRGVPLAARGDDPSIKEAARIALRRAIHASHGKKPVTDVHLVRV
jgi:ribonuclease J